MATKKSKPAKAKSKPSAKPKAKPVTKSKPVAKKKAVAKSKPTAKKKEVVKKVSKPAATSSKGKSKPTTKRVNSPKPPFSGKLKFKHIAIAGNIGAGKTTLTRLLANHFGWEPNFEEVDNNPYLNDFYEDMPRWSFPLQVFFLNSRFNQIIQIQRGNNVVIQDRTIYEDAQIFAPNLHAMNLMTRRDFDNYTNLFNTINQLIHAPDLLIYLRGSIPALVGQIEKRNRDYEENIRIEYLRRLNEHYEAWITNYKAGPLLIIDIDKINFADKKDHLNQVIHRVKTELNNLK